MEKEGVVEIRVISATDTIDSKMLLRDLGYGPAEIAEIVQKRDPKRGPEEIGRLYRGDHEEEVENVLECLSELNQSDIEYELLVEGEPESEEYLRNIIERFAGIREDIRREDELRFGGRDEG